MKVLKEKPMSISAPMYIYATEMIGEYYKKFKIKSKKVLTICGSGDQVLNAHFLDAKKVIGFDLNKNSKFMLNLKTAAIKTLTYKEFLTFFGKKSSNATLNYKVYLRIKKKLDEKTSSFFENLYRKYKYNGKKLRKSVYFRQRSHFEGWDATVMNLYLKNIKNYNKMKKLLESLKLEFIRSDIETILKNKKISKQKFDIINLSNVPNYFTREFKYGKKGDPVEYVIQNIFLKFKKILSLRGKIFFVSYSEKLYPNRISKTIPPISRKDTIEKLKKLRDFNVTVKIYKGITKGMKDKIVILQRLK